MIFSTVRRVSVVGCDAAWWAVIIAKDYVVSALAYF